MSTRRLLAACACAAGLIATSPAAAQADGPMRDVMLVGNAGAGTVSFIDATTFANLGSFHVTRDKGERFRKMNPIELAGFFVTRGVLGNDRFVDDLATSPDGTKLYVSRSALADTVAFDLTTGQMLWRTKMPGFRSDHMAITPDGSKIAVSATTAGRVVLLDTATGQKLTSFGGGTYVHGNDITPDGRYLYNASIGITSLPKSLEKYKGARRVTKYDLQENKVVRVYPFKDGVRPAVFADGFTRMYAQLSYQRGFIEYDLEEGKVLRKLDLPASESGATYRFDKYPQNSAHHGMGISADETKICAAGTIDDYVAVVERSSLAVQTITPVGDQPYWAQTGPTGNHCFVTNSKDGTVSVIDYGSGAEVARVPVGRYPQRERGAQVPQSVIDSLSASAG